MPKRVAITGPESTGKTALAKSLADFFGVEAVPEFARQYLQNFEHRYTLDDVIEIAKGQKRLIDDKKTKNERILIADTEFLVLKIWTKYVFKTVPNFIEEELAKQDYDIYLLCDVDLEWESDPLRENPDKAERVELFEMYRAELEKMKVNYKIISGIGNKRFQNALDLLKEFGVTFENG